MFPSLFIATLIALMQPPIPPNGDLYRAFFVWHFNQTDSILQSETYQQELINTCDKNGYNLIFLGVEPFLSPKGYSEANEIAVRNLIRALHQSGIEVHAVMGQGGTYGDPYARSPNGYGSNQGWAIENIIKPIQDYNSRAPDDSKFNGFLLDNEYYNNGKNSYRLSETIGTFDLLRIAHQMLPGLKIGHTPNWLLADEQHAYYINYNGKNNMEGFHILDQCDYVVVQTYRNNPSLQISMFNPWLDYASRSGRQVGIMIASDVDKPGDVRPDFTYNTLNIGDKIRFENSLTKISHTYHGNNLWWGNAVEMYNAYKNLK
jgi:hypothetical protein